jgi:hypothetical protein
MTIQGNLFTADDIGVTFQSHKMALRNTNKNHFHYSKPKKK